MLKPAEHAAHWLKTHLDGHELSTKGPGPVLRDLFAHSLLLFALGLDSHADGDEVAREELFSKEDKRIRGRLPTIAGS